ncbi:unnamed protein product [Paramecium sonneborni]|uniref:Uncharacterized protein n=1 Tax=Paramecium sonneborni TaxID=65129 RepID=A0A8S1RIL8_9CILI|nr:unnamed protein product [Paramecium sonneborni]
MNPNKNLPIVRLKFKCPPDCVCKSTEIRNWYHGKCCQPSFITSKGDIFCDQEGCSHYFIKDARFQCQKAQKDKTYYQYKSISEFLMAISLAMQASDYEIKSELEKQNFSKDLLQGVLERWNY